MSNSFLYQRSVAVYGYLAGKVPVVDNDLSSHRYEVYLDNPFIEDCIEFDFQTDRK